MFATTRAALSFCPERNLRETIAISHLPDFDIPNPERATGFLMRNDPGRLWYRSLSSTAELDVQPKMSGNVFYSISIDQGIPDPRIRDSLKDTGSWL